VSFTWYVFRVRVYGAWCVVRGVCVRVCVCSVCAVCVYVCVRVRARSHFHMNNGQDGCTCMLGGGWEGGWVGLCVSVCVSVW
jgi:hypothetical protein